MAVWCACHEQNDAAAQDTSSTKQWVKTWFNESSAVVTEFADSQFKVRLQSVSIALNPTTRSSPFECAPTDIRGHRRDACQEGVPGTGAAGHAAQPREVGGAVPCFPPQSPGPDASGSVTDLWPHYPHVAGFGRVAIRAQRCLS